MRPRPLPIDIGLLGRGGEVGVEDGGEVGGVGAISKMTFAVRSK